MVQGTVEPTYGSLGLALLKGGKTPPQALKSLLATDPRPAVRQVMVLDARGRAAAHTGSACLPESGHLVGRGFCVQADFAVGRRVWRGAAAGFRGAKGRLAERLLAGLAAGERSAGGARRGGTPRSAGVVVVAALPTNAPWEGRLLDLRVESSDAPLRELGGLLRMQEAYAHAASGEEFLSRGDVERGKREFSKALALAPQSSELRLWFALGLMRQGSAREARSVMRGALGRGQDIKAFVRELASRGIIREGGRRGPSPEGSDSQT